MPKHTKETCRRHYSDGGKSSHVLSSDPTGCSRFESLQTYANLGSRICSGAAGSLVWSPTLRQCNMLSLTQTCRSAHAYCLLSASPYWSYKSIGHLCTSKVELDSALPPPERVNEISIQYANSPSFVRPINATTVPFRRLRSLRALPAICFQLSVAVNVSLITGMESCLVHIAEHLQQLGLLKYPLSP